MRTLTVVTPATPTLPSDLALLLAPIHFAGAESYSEGYAGHAEGVILDEEGMAVAFVVRLSPKLAIGSPRTLVSASAMTVTDDSVLFLAWPEHQLLSQPRLDEDLQRLPRAAEDALVESSTPDIPLSTGGDVDPKATLKEGLEGTAIGAAFGALAGLATLTPIGVLALAAFFATGGGVLGVIAGASHDEPRKTARDDIGTEHHNPALRPLEERLRDPTRGIRGLVHTTRFSLPAPFAAPVEQQAPATRTP
jgi:hypothetical protein